MGNDGYFQASIFGYQQLSPLIAQATSRKCKGTTLEDAEAAEGLAPAFPEIPEMEPIEIEEFEEVEFEPRLLAIF